MKRCRLAAGVLALTLLTGCGFASPDDIAYQSSNIRRDETLITVDGQPITAEEYLFWLNNAIASQQMIYGGLKTDEDWQADADGVTVAEQIKADALEAAKLWRVMENKAQEMGVTLTQEEEDAVLAVLDSGLEALGSEEALAFRLDQMCISREGFLHLNRVSYLNAAVRQKIEEQGLLEVTPADVDAFLSDNGIYAAKHILISTRHISEDGLSYEEFTDEERSQATQLAQDLREQLAAAGDSEELFDQLMNEYSEDGRDKNGNLYYPNGYTYVTPGQMVEPFEEGALALEIGQISQPIQTDYGFHIILRIEPDRAQAENACDADYKFDQIARQWLDEAQVVTTKAYDKLDPRAFYTRLQEILDAKKATRNAQESAAASSAAPSQEASPFPSAESSPSSGS